MTMLKVTHHRISYNPAFYRLRFSQAVLTSDDDGSHSPIPGAVSALQKIGRSNPGRLDQNQAEKLHRRHSSENPNPPYKNPYHGPPPLKKPRLLYETPDHSRRPRTAPEQLPNTIQVPQTRPVFRRSYSDSTSFGSLASHISNSQPSDQREPHEDRDSPALPSFSWPRRGAGEDHNAITRSLSQTSLSDAELPHKRRKLHGQAEDEVKRIARPVGSEAFLPLDRSLDWISSPQSSQVQSSSGSSTATPSQPLHEQHDGREEPPQASPPIIIISSESSKQIEASRERRTELPSSSEPPILEMTPSSNGVQETSQQTSSERCLFRGLGLKPNVSPPQPKVGEEGFTSHITGPLQEFANQLSFSSFFRPIEVSRDIRVLERGYWLMEVNIVTDDVAEAARSAADPTTTMKTMQERFQGATASERLKKYDAAKRDGSLYQSGHSSESKAQGLWTEGELVQFWGSFSSFIEKGKAGWGTRLVGEDISDDSREALKVRIRIFTWGEVLGHLYLAIWVLSDKLAARVPMSWVASDGSHVVRMAGTRSKRGSLPPWTRKGPEGEKGCWGIASEG